MKFQRPTAVLLPLLFFAVSSFGQATESQALEVSWTSSIGTQSLRSWTPAELKTFRLSQAQEKDKTGKTLKWEGILLSRLVDAALEKLTVEQKAQVDLLVLKNGEGGQAIIPRHVVEKYPLLVAHRKSGKELDSATVVVPVSTAPKIQDEGLPLGTYGLAGLSHVELTSYPLRYSSLFLKRRTDPAAIRGEKMFVRNCIACHSGGPTSLSSNTEARSLASAGHSRIGDVPQLSERDVRALVSYLEAYRVENPRQNDK
ncbi:MAG: cytochrome c [Oligoflexia bacterium]|nr:cytochrome c [Oligoflexia bacterium]